VHADQRGDEQELGGEVTVGDRVDRVRRDRVEVKWRWVSFVIALILFT